MRRFVLSLGLALLGLAAIPPFASAQLGRPLAPLGAPPGRPWALPDLRITSVAEAGNLVRVIVKNQGARAAGPEVVRLQVFARGRLLGTYQAIAPPIPAGYSRAVLIRTNLRVNQPGLLLVVKADATNAVFERRERNNLFVKHSGPPLPLLLDRVRPLRFGWRL